MPSYDILCELAWHLGISARDKIWENHNTNIALARKLEKEHPYVYAILRTIQKEGLTERDFSNILSVISSDQVTEEDADAIRNNDMWPKIGDSTHES